MGAWIEIMSRLLEVIELQVAPHVGAWIEIDFGTTKPIRSAVAPHVGAWIEIVYGYLYTNRHRSHPTWVRGLK